MPTDVLFAPCLIPRRKTSHRGDGIEPNLTTCPLWNKPSRLVFGLFVIPHSCRSSSCVVQLICGKCIGKTASCRNIIRKEENLTCTFPLYYFQHFQPAKQSSRAKRIMCECLHNSIHRFRFYHHIRHKLRKWRNTNPGNSI